MTRFTCINVIYGIKFEMGVTNLENFINKFKQYYKGSQDAMLDQLFINGKFDEDNFADYISSEFTSTISNFPKAIILPIYEIPEQVYRIILINKSVMIDPLMDDNTFDELRLNGEIDITELKAIFDNIKLNLSVICIGSTSYMN